jgi:hypothetical protein
MQPSKHGRTADQEHKSKQSGKAATSSSGDLFTAVSCARLQGAGRYRGARRRSTPSSMPRLGMSTPAAICLSCFMRRRASRRS